jgi:hypothetical protein
MAATKEVAAARPVLVEVYAFRCGPALAYRRVADYLGPGETPDLAVARLIGLSGLEGGDAVVHSTSWRPMPDGTIVLTYAVAPDPLPAEPATPLEDLAIATGDAPSRPTPSEVTKDQVAAHAIRHLGFLMDTDPAARLALERDPLLVGLLGELPPTLAGRLATATT